MFQKKVYDLFAKCEYKLGEITNSPEYLEKWLVDNLENFDTMKQKYLKNLVLLLVLVWKNLTKKIAIMDNLI